MSVNTSEDYLDELLQAIEPIIGTSEPEVYVGYEPEEEMEYEPEATSAEAEYTEIVGEELSDTLSDVVAEDKDDSEVTDLLAALTQDGAEDIEDELLEQEEDVDALLSSFSNQPVSENTGIAYEEDVKELLKQFTEDEDLSDIQDILDKNDNGEALDDSMLELPDVEVFQMEEDSDELEQDSDSSSKAGSLGKVIGGIAGFFKKRSKKRKAKQADSENAISSVETEDNSISELEPDVGMEMFEADENSFLEMLGADEDSLVLDEDLSDIEQLLTGGSFDEPDIILEDGDTGIADTADNRDGKRKNKKNGKEKKVSLFSRVLNALTEEIDESPKKRNGVPEADETGVTSENLNILEELSKEDKKKAKKAKKEEKQNKKDKKNAKNAGKKGDDDSDDDFASRGKKAKESKKPKKQRVKKEKPKPVEVITKPEKKLPRKRVFSTLVLCFSILAAILILQNIVYKTDTVKEAMYAYDKGDYATCYANLQVVDRSEEEEELYQKSMIIMSVQRKWDAYNNYLAMGNQIEALNSLLEGVRLYHSQEETALEHGVHAQIVVVYQDIMDALQGYGLSASDVDEILGYESKVTYTKRLDSIINGTPFVLEEATVESVIIEEQPLQDVLPGEEDFLPDDAIIPNEPVIMEETNEGETVVVGSNPVNVSSQDERESFEEPVSVGGQNVGSGSTNLASEVTGQSVIVGIR